MLVKGRKIKMIKAMPNFNKVGQEFEVTDIKDGAIFFKCNFGSGLMSYKEYKQYFEEVEEVKTLQWSKWKSMLISDEQIAYRTNGKDVQVSYLGGLGVAKCHEEDTFDLSKGIELAHQRAKINKILIDLEMAKKEHTNLLKTM